MIETFKRLEKYNFWDGKPAATGFQRSAYLEKIEKYLGSPLVKVIMGQRRTGKSYLLRQIIAWLISQGTNPKNIFYLNKELVDFDDVKSYRDVDSLIRRYREQLRVQGRVYVFLDEVQDIASWEKIVNSLSQDFRDQYEVFITGSNSTLLSSELATLLSGRSITFTVYPFSFDEYAAFYKVPRAKEHYLAYLAHGGLPELFHLADDEAKRQYVASLLDTVLLKDIVQRYTIRDPVLLEQLFKFLAGNIGNLFSVKAIADYLTSHGVKTNVETLSNYLAYLEQTFLVHGVDRYDIRGKKVFTTNKKYYLNDLAFRRYLSAAPSADAGSVVENAVYLHYLALGYTVRVGALYATEIDFVLEKNRERVYAQVAYVIADEETRQREFGNLEKIKDAHKKLVISLDDLPLTHPKGILHLRPWEL